MGRCHIRLGGLYPPRRRLSRGGDSAAASYIYIYIYITRIPGTPGPVRCQDHPWLIQASKAQILAFRRRCFLRLLLGHPLARLLWPSGSVWVSFGSLWEDFVRPFRPLVGFCWLALTLERKPIFSGLGGRWPALVRPLFQVFIPGCVFYACLSEVL